MFYNVYDGRIVRSPRETVGLFVLHSLLLSPESGRRALREYVERWGKIIVGIFSFLVEIN